MKTEESSFAGGSSVGGDTKALSLKVTPKHDMVGLENAMKSLLFCATLRAGEPAEEHQRAPIDVVVSLDVSHSMFGQKLELCKNTLKLLLRVLGPNDRVGLVSYASDARVDFPPLHMTKSNKEVCLRKIEALDVRGSTNISSAIGLAVREMTSIVNPNEVQQIFLLTDGEANQGISDHDGLVEFTKNCFTHRDDKQQQAVSRSPIGLTCFGYGEGHNAQLLQDMATAVMGSYYFVQDDSDVGSAFGDALGGVLSVVAQSAVLTFRVPDDAAKLGVEIVKVHHETAIEREPLRVFTVTVGDFYAEETRDILIEVKLAGSGRTKLVTTADGPVRHLVVTADFTDTMLRTPDQLGPVESSVFRPADSSDLSPPNQHVATQWMRVMATNAYKECSVLAGESNFAAARTTMGTFAGQLQTYQASLNGTQDELVSQLQRDTASLTDQLQSEQQYRLKGSKFMSNATTQYSQQRCMESTATTSNTFRSARKKKWATMFSHSTK